MSLEIKIDFSEKDNMWIFEPKGEIDIYTSSILKKEILDNFESKERDILIKGEELNYIDSTGLGALIYILKKLQEKNFKVHLSNIKPNIKRIFDITELDKLFNIRGEENE